MFNVQIWTYLFLGQATSLSAHIVSVKTTTGRVRRASLVLSFCVHILARKHPYRGRGAYERGPLQISRRESYLHRARLLKHSVLNVHSEVIYVNVNTIRAQQSLYYYLRNAV